MTKEQRREYDREWSRSHREQEARRCSVWRSENREKWNAYMRLFRAKNKDRVNADARKRRDEKGRGDNFKAWNAAWAAGRRALTIAAMPPWIKREQIISFYQEAKRKSLTTGIAHEVDHIWPLHGRGFVGLHVPWNLRVIPKVENRQKRNKIPTDKGVCL